jgi:hypothetical protein
VCRQCGYEEIFEDIEATEDYGERRNDEAKQREEDWEHGNL